MFKPCVDVEVSGAGVHSRRGFMKTLAAAAGSGPLMLSWRDLAMARSEELRKSGKKMILLWMDGGPSQYETFNPKIGSERQGPTTAIDTKLPGIQFAEFWPQMAQMNDKITLIRSMVSGEADHARAIKLVRSGYPSTPAVKFPTWGSVVARDREEPDFELPAYVRILKPRIATRDIDEGVLGSNYSAFRVDTPGELPDDVIPKVESHVLQRRLSLAGKLDDEFAARGAVDEVEEKRNIYRRTTKFVLSPRLERFSLDSEPEKLRDEYGRTPFGQACLLARRLVEAGTSFVEIIHGGTQNDQGWDTHKTGFKDTPALCSEVDPGYATLLRDLEDRGMLEDTLVVWMGEFGRTPKLKGDGGRDHYAKGWQAALAGGGVVGGQVIGTTDKDGIDVEDRPVSVQDLFVSFCHVLGMDPREEYVTPDARPIKLVEGGELIGELFG